MLGLEEVYESAEKILLNGPDPVVRLRILRDALQKPEDSQEVIEARRNVINSRWVRVLTEEQWEDGSWGRLHSKDYGSNQQIPTTEVGVERALNLGLDKNHPVLKKAIEYLISVLETGECRDRPEKNDRWPTGLLLITAATLAKILPKHLILDGVWELWVELVRRTFAAGRYNEEAEIKAHQDLTGASVKGSYLVASNKYTLSLLASGASDLPSEIEEALLNWIWHKEGGLNYLGEMVSKPPIMKPGHVERWFLSQELLAGYPGWSILAADMMQWLWEARSPDGKWDFGPRGPNMLVLPMSESWRRRGARQNDWTTRVLLLLRSFYSPQSNSI